MHKLTTRLCRENQAVVIEDLNIKGMPANERLAPAISDVADYEQFALTGRIGRCSLPTAAPGQQEPFDCDA